MATFPQILHRAVALLLLTVAPGVGGCDQRTGTPLPPTRSLLMEPLPETIWVRPGDQGAVRFRVRTVDGAVVPMLKVSFVIVDEPMASQAGSQSQGATLSAAAALTDGQGVAQIDVTAGQQTVFRIRASIQELEAEAVIVVATGLVGSVEVAPFLAAGSSSAGDVTRIEIAFFDNLGCGALSAGRPPTPARTVRAVSAHDGTAQFDFVSTELGHAIVGRARDARGGVVAAGCVDLPGPALVSGGVVRIALLLDQANPSAAGRFAVTSRFVFANPVAATEAVIAPWRDLQDCPLDPSQIWLDCTLDALSGPVDGDPNDCQPRAAALEGPLGPALAARRGTFLPLAGGGTSSCRGSSDGGGAISHDALVTGLFGSPKPRPLIDLLSVADDAGQILASVTLRSQLVIRETTEPGAYQALHTFTGASFAVPSATYEVPLLPLALPVLEVPGVRATDTGRMLNLPAHAITLRMGTVARVAFGELALVRRGLPADSRRLLEAITALAKAPTSMSATDPAEPPAGCVALDSVLCKDLGRPIGCLMKACQDGLAALALRLDVGFSAADGDGLDLILAGSAPLLDPHGTGFADRLGDALSTPGTWSAAFHTRAGVETVSGVWDAFRTGN